MTVRIQSQMNLNFNPKIPSLKFGIHSIFGILDSKLKFIILNFKFQIPNLDLELETLFFATKIEI